MFSKKIAAPVARRSDRSLPPHKVVPSIFSSDLMITGDMYSEGEINIEGKVEGSIKCRKAILGPSSNVKGNITADSVSVSGRFEGKIVATKVFLSSTASVFGEITHESIEIEMGAYLEGVCHRTSEPMPAHQSKEDYMITDLTETEFVVEVDKNDIK